LNRIAWGNQPGSLHCYIPQPRPGVIALTNPHRPMLIKAAQLMCFLTGADSETLLREGKAVQVSLTEHRWRDNFAAPP